MDIKTYLVTSLTCGALVSGLQAEVPKDASSSDYRVLLSRSPFVIKKPEVGPARVNNTYSLRSALKLEEGWYVTLVDAKKPTENIRLKQGEAATQSGLQLVKVNQNKQNYKDMSVVVEANGQQMTIGFNENELKRSIQSSKVAMQKTADNRVSPPVNQPTATPANDSAAVPPTPTRRPRVRRVQQPSN